MMNVWERGSDMRKTLLKYVTLSFLLMGGTATAQTSLNVSLFGNLNPVPVRYSGCWGWTSPTGNEYALLGGFQGTHIIAIDDSTNIFQADFIDGQDSNWREITVIGNHAFVVTEGGGDLQGMQVIDLSPLPDSVHLVTTYTGTFTRGHIIARDETSDSSYVYISGTSTTGGVHILDVSDPATPVQVGIYDPVYYIHDAHVRGNRMYASALGDGLDIVDITTKSAPMLIGLIDHPMQFTHSAWTTADESHIVVTDEIDGLPARIWNIEDINNPFEVAQYSANLQSLVHNPYILNQYLFVSHNTEGLRVVDIADPSVPVEVGYYDTFSGPSGGFNGLWSAYPYFPSGKVMGGNREDGLYIWRFNDTQAGRFYGQVLDSVTGVPISGASISILETGRTTTSDPDGYFKLGELPSDPGGYSVMAAATDYSPQTLLNLVLNGGDSIWVEFRLPSLISSTGEAGDQLPLNVRLHQNYPNPFNPSTSISYTLNRTSHIRLRIHDSVGRLVRVLLDETQSRGFRTIIWDGKDGAGHQVGSGVYIYRLDAAGSTNSKKMIYLR